MPGVAAGSVNIFRGRLVLVYGPSGAVTGVFVYAAGTTPGPGNAPIFWATSSATDPYGNAIPSTAGVSGTGTFEAGNTLITPQGVLTYSSLPPTLGGLVSSLGVTASFNDSAGNLVLPGDSSYSNAIVGYSLANSMQGGSLLVYSSASFAGPWQQIVVMGGVQNDGEMHFQATGGSHLVADTILYKLSNSGFGREIWNDMRPLQNSFVGTIANRYPPQYRLAPDGNVEVAGFVQFPPSGGPNFNTLTFFTFPSGYIPANNTGHKWPITLETNVTPVGTALVQVDTSGNMQFHNCPASGMASNVAAIYGRYPLSSTQLIIS